jgi:long-chain acyl-CoA synthetase
MLPLSHIYARTCDLYLWLGRRCRFALASKPESAVAEMSLIHPTVMNAVPYFYDKICKALTAAGKAETPGAVREMLGGSVRMCISGGAPLPEHVERFFAGQEMLLLQGYGLTECSPVISASTPEARKLGSVGPAIPGAEVKIADDGEILTRGPHVMRGYWKDENTTAEVVRDGWLHTGDLGYLDEEGFLFIRGRSKEILVTAAGKNIVPTFLEGLITSSPFVAQAMVVGDGRNYLTALIVPDPNALRDEIIRRKIPVLTPAQALAHAKVQEIYREELDRLLADVSHHEQVRRFTLLDRGFSIEQEELTPKLSLRRDVIAEHFATTIEQMYAAPDGPNSDSS